MRKTAFLTSAFAVLASIVILSSCNKNKEYDLITVPSQIHFLSTSKFQSYYVENTATTSFSVGLGTTDVAGSDRAVTYKVTSPSGAVAGTHYTITSPSSGNTVTIPAGSSTAAIQIKGIFAAYSTGRKDTLVFSLAEPSLAVAGFSDTLKVVLQRYCPVTDAAVSGAYANSRDYWPSVATANQSAAKYTATISNFTATSATTATVLIKNLGNTTDMGFAPFAPTDPATTGLTATLDWTDPANFKVTLPSQNYVASLYTYGQSTISGSGTFSTCDQTMTLSYVVRVSAGSFTNQWSVLTR